MEVITQGDLTMATIAGNSWYITILDFVLDRNLLPVTKHRRMTP
jgi:hypothetical protein